MNQSIKSDIYDVKSYTDTELYNILDLINPSDRELEAQIIFYIRKYQQIQSADSKQLEQFFQDIYTHFFIRNQEEDEETDTIMIDREGFTDTTPDPSSTSNTIISDIKPNSSIKNDSNTNNQIQTVNFTNTLSYAPNNLNPLLKQTIKRMIVIDSQFREWQKSFSTNFTVNFSEVLKDVVSLNLTSFQIPYTWYTINNDYGSNFFYIKGNSPGIDNGNHDYKIAIPPGNYTAPGINDAINTSFKTIIQTYTDVCFNKTGILYDVPNCKSTLNVAIEDIYDYSNYVFSFDEWETPNQTIRNTNIASCLGFNYKEYSINSFYSARLIQNNILTAGINDKQINNSNNTIKIIQYWNDSFSITDYMDYSSNTLKYNTFSIILDPAVKRSASNIVNNVNNKLKSSIYLDPLSELSLVPIQDISVNNYGKSFFKWTIKLNRKTTVNRSDSKTVVLLPDISNDTIWVGASSLFQFNNYINELSSFVSETPAINTLFDTSGVSIKLTCISQGYNLPINDISYGFKSESISLNNFLYQIQTYLFKRVGNKSSIENYIYSNINSGLISRKTDLTGSYVTLNTDSKIEFKFDIIQTIYGDQFIYDISNSFFNNNLYSAIVDTSSNTTIDENEDKIYVQKYNGKIEYSPSYSFQNNPNIISIKSNSSYMSGIFFNIVQPTSNYTITGGIQALSDSINGLFKSFSDFSGSYPVNQSFILFTQNKNNPLLYDYEITIIVKKILNETDFVLVLYDSKYNTVEDSIWYQDFNLRSENIIYKTDFSYNLNTFSNSNNECIISSPITADLNYNYLLSGIFLDFSTVLPNNNFRITIRSGYYNLSLFKTTLNKAFFDFSNSFIDISGTNIDIVNNRLTLTLNIKANFNSINYFNVIPGNFLYNVLNYDTSYNTNLSTKTFFGKITRAANYYINNNSRILTMNGNNISFIVDMSSKLQTYFDIDLLFTDVINSVKTFTDISGSYPLSKSSITVNPIYNYNDFTNLFAPINWVSGVLPTGSPKHSSVTEKLINFSVDYTSIFTSHDTLDIIPKSNGISTFIQLSFIISYNWTSAISTTGFMYIALSHSLLYNANNRKSSFIITRISDGYSYQTGIGSAAIGFIPNLLESYRVNLTIHTEDQIGFFLYASNVRGNVSVNITDFSYSYIDVPVYYNWSLNVVLDKQITETEYSMKLSNIYAGDDINSLWYTYFNFSLNPLTSNIPLSPNIFYYLLNYADLSNNNSIIKSKDIVKIDTVDLRNSKSNILWLKPYLGAEGVYDSSHKNDISFNIPYAIYYTIDNLKNTINSLFDANPITKGTTINIQLDGYCYINWNINKKYTTSDYKVVFYDSTSFVKCFIGNSSYRNSSPDATLGWIMGFHALTEYILKGGDYISADNYYINPFNMESTGNVYTITNDNIFNFISLTGDTIVNVELYKYLMIIVDDYTQNHLNDGLVTIAQKDTSLVLPSYASRSKYNCDPITGQVVNTGITSGTTNNLTQNQLYSVNQIINAQNTKLSLISAGPFAKDVFAMIPLDVGGMKPGQVFTDKVTGVQDRVYFGPVNIHKLAIKLINDKGDVLDLNGANWSLQLLCEQLYQTSPISNPNSKTKDKPE